MVYCKEKVGWTSTCYYSSHYWFRANQDSMKGNTLVFLIAPGNTLSPLVICSPEVENLDVIIWWSIISAWLQCYLLRIHPSRVKSNIEIMFPVPWYIPIPKLDWTSVCSHLLRYNLCLQTYIAYWPQQSTSLIRCRL